VLLAIIIVSYNTRELLRACLRSVAAELSSSGLAARIVVVDNDSHDGTPTLLRAEFPQVELIESGGNLGFAGGNNLALRRPLCEAEPPDALFLLNPDTELAPTALATLLDYLAQHPAVAVVGPQLRYPDGSQQPSRRRFPTRATFFLESTPLETYWPNNRWASRYRMADTPDDLTQPVDWLVGAALLVRRAAIERAGLLDAGFLMYSEEMEWQQRIAAAGGQGLFVPAALVVHHEGKSSEQAPARRYINFQRSRLRHAALLYGPRFATLLRAFLLVAYGLELASEAAKWLLGHKRPLRATRVRVYWEVVLNLAARGW